MSKPPAFQFYPTDWLSDARVQMLSPEAEGCYIRLLCYAWIEGSIPADGVAMARLCKVNGQAMQDAAALFCPHPSDPSKLIHKRLVEERKKMDDRRNLLSESGKRGAEATWGGHRAGLGSSSSSSSSSSSKKQERECDSGERGGDADEDKPITQIDGKKIFQSMRAALGEKPEGLNRSMSLAGFREALCTLYKRDLEDPLDYAEESLMVLVARRPNVAAEVDAIQDFKRKLPSSDKKYFPGSITSLLEKWSQTLDRARNFTIPSGQSGESIAMREIRNA